MISSIENVTSKSDRRVDSKWLNHRNHHTDGQTQISNFIKMLFGDPELNDDSEDAFEKYIYLTHLSQAVCTTEQVNGIFINFFYGVKSPFQQTLVLNMYTEDSLSYSDL